MAIYFGSVQRYDVKKGFGFVSRAFHNSKHTTAGIFFHIKTLRYYSFELAQTLDNGHYQDVSFWYEFEKTDKGEQASRLWLTAKDIPSEELDILRIQVEKLWHDVTVYTPVWLPQVTIDLVGQLRKDKLNHEREILLGQQQDAREKDRQEKEAERIKQLGNSKFQIIPG